MCTQITVLMSYLRKLCKLCFYLYNQNLLLIQKIHLMHLQQCDENHCVYLAIIGRHSEERPRMRNIKLFIFA